MRRRRRHVDRLVLRGAVDHSGGDAGPVVDTSVVPADAAVGWQDFDVTDLVQDWIAGGAPNNGVLIKAPSGDVVFASEDYGYSPALRPELEIIYEDPAPVGIPTVAVVAPRDGERVRDTIAVDATAGDDRRVDRVEFLLDGAEFAEDATAPYSVEPATRWLYHERLAHVPRPRRRRRRERRPVGIATSRSPIRPPDVALSRRRPTTRPR